MTEKVNTSGNKIMSSQNFDTLDHLEDRYTMLVNETAVVIMSHVKPLGTTTTGAIRRAVMEILPEHDRYIQSALKSLKMLGEVDYREDSPAPTKVHCRAMKRITRKTLGYGKSAILPKRPVEPYPEIVYGEAFKGQI